MWGGALVPKSNLHLLALEVSRRQCPEGTNDTEMSPFCSGKALWGELDSDSGLVWH